jgi:hypothetical protein
LLVKREEGCNTEFSSLQHINTTNKGSTLIKQNHFYSLVQIRRCQCLLQPFIFLHPSGIRFKRSPLYGSTTQSESIYQ